MTEDTSSGAGATPQAGSPAMGTPAPGGAMPPTATPTLEEVLRERDELKHKYGNVAEELDRHRKFRASYDKQQAEAEAAKKAADEAQLSEIERVKKQHAETEQQAQKYKQQFITTSVRLAAKDKGIIDPELAAMAITSSLEYDKDGMPTNVDEALDALIKQKPYLAPKPADPPATPAQSAAPARAATPALPAMNPGRTQITAPGSNLPPGRITLAEIHNRRK